MTTGEELAAEVCNQQGYLVIGSTHPRKIGESIPQPYSGMPRNEKLNVCLLVTQESNRSEYLRQSDLADSISAMKSVGDPQYKHYYRVIPQD